MPLDTFTIRPATRADTPALFQLIQGLAKYENLEHTVTGTPEALATHLFEDPVYAEAIVAASEDRLAGFALFFINYSTFLTQPGLYLEDIFVLPEYRGQGIGKALLLQVSQLAADRDYGRMEWSVLDWNQPAIAFYERLGATVLPDWRICRVTGDGLRNLASTSASIGFTKQRR